MRLSRYILPTVVVIVLAVSLLPRFCRSDERRTISVEESRVVVTNLSGKPWTDVTVWLNDYYRAQAPALAPDQRLEVPLDVFVAGWGQRFDRARQAPAGIEVTAQAKDGGTMTFTWGSGRRR